AVAVQDRSRRTRFRKPTDSEIRCSTDIPAPSPIGNLSPIPNEHLPPNDNQAFFVSPYGIRTWGSLYNPRQALAIATFARHVRDLEPEILAENLDLGDIAAEFATAIVTYLGLCVSKLAVLCSTMTNLDPDGSPPPIPAFEIEAIRVTWEYLEINPISDRGAYWKRITDDIESSIKGLSFPGHAHCQQASVDELPFGSYYFDAIMTEPPDYDAVPYADLSDCFYVWLRRMLSSLHPGALSTPLTPKKSEIRQNRAHKSPAKDYDRALSRAFSEINRTMKDNGIVVLVFPYKSTTALERLLNTLVKSNLLPTASWPIQTQSPQKLHEYSRSAPESSVFVVCRKLIPKSCGLMYDGYSDDYFDDTYLDDGFLEDVEPALFTRLRERLDYFWDHGIRGADFFLSAIGPAIEVFGSYKRVLKSNGDVVSFGDLLGLSRRIVADYALERIAGTQCARGIDNHSRFYLIWRWIFGNNRVDCGEAGIFAQSMGLKYASLVSKNGMLSKMSGQVCLKGPIERKSTENLGAPSSSVGFAPCIDVLHRATAIYAYGDIRELTDFLAVAIPPGADDLLFQLAESLMDMLPTDDIERSTYKSFLVGTCSLRSVSNTVDSNLRTYEPLTLDDDLDPIPF
ncbi:MAG: hypothetical protein FWD57_09860, partial [Polyangiaceae bacterium]|nr:hypothetical protein [Polyangiaceae bacterium]